MHKLCLGKKIFLATLQEVPQSKRHSIESTDNSSVDAASRNKVWECFTEILHDCGATTDTDEEMKLWLIAFI